MNHADSAPAAPQVSYKRFSHGGRLWRWQMGVLGLSIFFFAVACATPALKFTPNQSDDGLMYGLWVLAIGWMGILVDQYGWLANLLLGLSYLLLIFRLWLPALIVNLFTLFVAAQTLTLFGQELPADESNVNKMTLEYLGVGFYFWLLSILTVGVGAIVLWIIARQQKRSS